MVNYDASLNYYNSSNSKPSDKSKMLGAALLGGLLGTTCYYLPVSKDTFVNVAYGVKKNNVENDIKALTQAADEISKNKITNESKILLNRLGLNELIDEISNKCRELKEGITDADTVKSMKKDFADNFKKYKKDASLMDTVTSKAMSTIKWNGFKWGMGIGAVLGLALSLVLGRNSNN